ncbi:MAG TPA: M28 family peptidase [Acidimicrobiales bacterium]|nr:M28 family peptidase [Acidimicrobiales bacterium]
MSDRPRRAVRRAGGALVASVVLAASSGAPASAAGAGQPHGPAGGRQCGVRTNDTYDELLACVGADQAAEHLQELQAIADANGGTRASATAGYDASAAYVARRLEAAGYHVTRQAFEFPFFAEEAPAVLEQVAPTPTTYETGTFEYSGEGDVTGTVVPVDLQLTGDRDSDSGCEPEDFDGPGWQGTEVALLQRGACDFAVKARLAQEAGAEAVVVFNQGDAEGRFDLAVGTLGDTSAGVVTVPVVGLSFDDGASLATADTAHVVTDVLLERRTTENVIADGASGNPGNVVMAGAHLDSVLEGPGINDNGSGSAALLATALAMRKVRPVNQVRFAWWGAEESGLVGSTHYVEALPAAERERIALYMNYDMVASPNFVPTVYDADESTFPAADLGVTVPPGSTAVEDLYERFYTWRGVPYDDTAFSGRSDYDAFVGAGIPSSGLFTGAEEGKTAEQAAIWGGTAGVPFDPCYHQGCDTIDNVSREVLDVNADAVAFAMLTFAYSTRAVNGVPGTPVPGRPLRLPPPAGPEGTFVTGGGLAAAVGTGA